MRTRAGVLVLLACLTFALTVLGMVYLSGNDRFFLVIVLDLPAIVILLVLGWAERSHG